MRFYLLILIYALLLIVFSLTEMAFVWIILITALFFIIVILGVSVMRFNLFLPVQSEIKNSTNEIALTFDDGPDRELTPQVLNLLEQYQVKATFFCIGSKIEGSENIVRQIASAGHSIGNHTYEHSNTFPIWSVKKMKQSIIKTDKLISDIIGKECVIFRPPFGVINNLIAAAIKSLNKKTIGWSIRTKDSCKSPDQVIKKLKKQIKPGAIILFHDTNPNILMELQETLDYCKQKSLKSIAIS